MTMASPYRCPEAHCLHAALECEGGGLRCANGHFFPFAPRSSVPLFATASASEYTAEKAAEIHDNALRWLFATFAQTEDDLRSRLVARLGLKKGARVLVTGAGAGNDLPYLVAAMSGCGEIYAQDIAKEMLLAAVDRYRADPAIASVKLEFSVSDAMSLPFADASFDAAYHFGGINLFPDIARGIAEMDRVVRPGGRVLFGDEGMAPWLRETELGKMLINNNALYGFSAPLAALPASARDVKLSWELCNTFFVIDYCVSGQPLPVNIDVPHVGRRGGSIRTRYYGGLEGVSPELRDEVYAMAEQLNLSRFDFIEDALRKATGKR